MPMRRRGRMISFGKDLAAPGIRITAKSWDTPVMTGGEPWRAIDGDNSTFWSTPHVASYPADLGLEFSRPMEVAGLEIVFQDNMHTKGLELVPTAEEQELQYWAQGIWRRLETRLENEPGKGWIFKHTCDPVQTTRLRLVVRHAGTEVMYIRHLSVISKDLEHEPQSLLWSSAQQEPAARVCSALNDENPDTYLPLVALEAVGYAWPRPVKVNGVLAQYCHFGFGEEDRIPQLSEQVLEAWDGQTWKPVGVIGARDWASAEAWGKYVHAGLVTCAFRFDEITCRKLRLRFTGPRRRAAIGQLTVYDSPAIKGYVAKLLDAGESPAAAGVRGYEVDLGRDFPMLLSQGSQKGQLDYIKLNALDQRLSRIKSFEYPLTSKRGTSPDHLRDGRLDTWWSPARGVPVDIGVEWLEPRMLGRVIFQYRAVGGKRLEPAYDGQDLQCWDGNRWQSLQDEVELDESALAQGYTTWIHTFFPTATARLRLVITQMDPTCTAGDAPALISFQAYEDISRAHRDWFSCTRPDPYGRWLMYGGAEPNYEAVSAHVLHPIMRAPVGFRSRETLGHLRDIAESAVAWEGTVLTPWPKGIGGGFRTHARTNWFVGFAFGVHPRLQGIPHWAIQRSLIDGYLPGVEYTHYQDGISYRQTVLASEIRGPAAQGKIANFIRITVENKSSTTRKTNVVVVTGCHLGYPNRPITRTGWRHDAKARQVRDAQGNLVLMYSAGGRFLALPAEQTVTYALTLKPGAKQSLVIRQPTFRCAGADIDKLAQTPFDKALAYFRQSWKNLLDSGTQVRTPEDRINRTYRACLTQQMLAEHAGWLPDGLWPSHYYWATLGWEDCWTAEALADYGFLDIAKKCIGECLLSQRVLSKETLQLKYSVTGWAPGKSIRIGRLVRDKSWLKTLVPILVENADWLLAERRITRQAKGLHAGLLPKNVYGGDIHDPAYSLIFNTCSWFGLRETGRLLVELGEIEKGRFYLNEARTYRTRLLQLMRAGKYTRQKPTAVPGRLYWHRPYDFTSTHFAAFLPEILEMGILSAREEAEAAAWLEQSGRLLCGVQLFAGGMILDHNRPKYFGFAESQYNLGYQLTYLKHDQVERYLLGVYGLITLNLDRDLFTGGEQNELGLSEEDRMISLRCEKKQRAKNWLESSDPDSNPSANFLILLRNLLVFEEQADGLDTGVLWLNKAAPRPWFADGKILAVKRAPTHYGPISYEVQSRVRQGQIIATVDASGLEGVQTIALRFRHPDKVGMKKVLVNGKAITTWDADQEMIRLTPTGGKLTVTATY